MRMRPLHNSILQRFYFICLLLVLLVPPHAANAIDFLKHEEQLEQTKQNFGATHPSTLAHMYMLAELYATHGQFRKAEHLYELLIRYSSARHTVEYYPDSTLLMDNLAKVYAMQGLYGKAEQLYKQTGNIRVRRLGADHPTIAYTNYYLASLYSMQNKFQQAEQLYLQNLSIKQKFNNDNNYIHWLVRDDIKNVLINSAKNLAKLYRIQQRHRESEWVLASLKD